MAAGACGVGELFTSWLARADMSPKPTPLPSNLPLVTKPHLLCSDTSLNINRAEYSTSCQAINPALRPVPYDPMVSRKALADTPGDVPL